MRGEKVTTGFLVRLLACILLQSGYIAKIKFEFYIGITELANMRFFLSTVKYTVKNR
jgi:hypothetical protein